MQPNEFINKVIEDSRLYLEQDSLVTPICWMLNPSGNITNAILPVNNPTYKYRSMLIIKNHIKQHKVVAYAIIKKTTTEEDTAGLNSFKESKSLNKPDTFRSYRSGLSKASQEERKNARLDLTSRKIMDALEVSFISEEEKKVMVIPYSNDFGTIKFEGYKEEPLKGGKAIYALLKNNGR